VSCRASVLKPMSDSRLVKRETLRNSEEFCREQRAKGVFFNRIERGRTTPNLTMVRKLVVWTGLIGTGIVGYLPKRGLQAA
jgi:hypothetical protein